MSLRGYKEIDATDASPGKRTWGPYSADQRYTGSFAQTISLSISYHVSKEIGCRSGVDKMAQPKGLVRTNGECSFGYGRSEGDR